MIGKKRLKTIRSAGNHRLVLREDLIEYLNQKGLIYNDVVDSKRDVVYARVSNLVNGNLDRQALFLIEHVPDIQKLLYLVCNN